MTEILFVTNNIEKFRWAEKRLKEYGIKLIQKRLDIPESRKFEIEKIAIEKANFCSKLIQKPFFVEDTGYEIKCLKNFPGAYLKLVLITIGVEGLCLLARDKKDKETNFKSVLVYCDENKNFHSFVCNDIGKISDIPRGNNRNEWGDIMKIHIPKGFDKTLAEMNEEEFNMYAKEIEKEEHYTKLAIWLKK